MRGRELERARGREGKEEDAERVRGRGRGGNWERGMQEWDTRACEWSHGGGTWVDEIARLARLTVEQERHVRTRRGIDA